MGRRKITPICSGLPCSSEVACLCIHSYTPPQKTSCWMWSLCDSPTERYRRDLIYHRHARIPYATEAVHTHAQTNCPSRRTSFCDMSPTRKPSSRALSHLVAVYLGASCTPCDVRVSFNHFISLCSHLPHPCHSRSHLRGILILKKDSEKKKS